MFLRKLQIVEKYLVEDLINLSEEDQSIFAELFIGRNKEVDRFISFVDLFKSNGLNLLISAEAGVGKTHYISNLLLKDELQNSEIYYINLDYRKLTNQNIEKFLIFFIHEMLKYFKEIQEPLNDVNQNDYDNIKENIRKINDHFEFVSNKKNENSKWKHLTIILDDLDYVEETLWSVFLDNFIFYAAHRNSSLIISCRPPLEAALKTDPRTKRFMCNVPQAKTIKLEPLNIIDIVNSRLSYIYNNSGKYIQKIMQITLKLNNGIDNTKHYIFHKKHYNFIKMFSNGNIREMLYMFTKNLKHVINNRKDFEFYSDNTVNFKRENILKLYFDDTQIEDCCKILDLTIPSSIKTRLPLYYNVLITIADRKIIDEDLLSVLIEDLKFKREDVINAIIFMSSNEQRIIHPISNGKQDKELSVDKRIYREYILSSRGEAYITNISAWEPYIKRVKNNLIDKYTELVYKDNHLD